MPTTRMIKILPTPADLFHAVAEEFTRIVGPQTTVGGPRSYPIKSSPVLA